MEPTETPNVPWLGLSDPVAALTHLIAAALAAGAIVQLWTRSRESPGRRASVLVFGASMFVQFLASGAYHAVSEPWRTPLRRVDHAAIYLFIAGSFTPVVAHLPGGRQRGWVLAFVWALAASGIVLKLAFFDVV